VLRCLRLHVSTRRMTCTRTTFRGTLLLLFLGVMVGMSNAQVATSQQMYMQQQMQQSGARKVATAWLPVPCFVPTSYYPLRTCGVSNLPQDCGRGFNAWSTYEDCCSPASGAFPQGCTDINKPVECWIPDSFYPDRTCKSTNNLTRCSYNWGQWSSQTECCAPGKAFPQGCSMAQTCWVASQDQNTQACVSTSDIAVCSRSWGTYGTQVDCCLPGNAYIQGCGNVAGKASQAGTAGGPTGEPPVLATQGQP